MEGDKEHLVHMTEEPGQNEAEILFLSSTPKKSFPCQEFEKGLAYTDSIVEQMLGMEL